MIGQKLPHQPEPIEQMRARWHNAVSFTVDAKKCEDDPDHAYFPSQHRRHVFDFDDGLRLVVSHDTHSGKEVLHVSASGTDGFVKQYKTEIGCLTRVAAVVKVIGDTIVQKPPIGEIRHNGVIHLFWNLG